MPRVQFTSATKTRAAIYMEREGTDPLVRGARTHGNALTNAAAAPTAASLTASALAAAANTAADARRHTHAIIAWPRSLCYRRARSLARTML